MRISALLLPIAAPLAANAFAPAVHRGVAKFATRTAVSLRAQSAVQEEALKEEKAPGLSPRDARIKGPLSAAFLAALPKATSAAELQGGTARTTFDSSLGAYFPGAVSNSLIASRIVMTLKKRGFDADNTLLGTSLCSDEVNDTPLSLFSQLQKGLTKGNSGGVFNLGGLGGVPFVGPSGFGAFFSHCPQSGKVVIVFGPHVGIGNNGIVGKVERVGMDKQSGACGAALGAYKAIKAEKERAEKIRPSAKAAFPYSDDGAGDVQEDYIIRELRRKLENTDLDGPDDNALIALVTNRMYDMVSELLIREVQAATNNPGFWDKISEVVLVGGIVINKGNAKGEKDVEDYFKPLSFQSWKAGGVRENLFDSLYNEEATTGTFESALNANFPGALPNSAISSNVVATLRKRGYEADNTLLGTSLCSDEVNDTPLSLFSQLQKGLTKGNSGGVFNLGGLGGVPFVGPSGFGAFFSHCPKSGKVVIVYGPHVGISRDGVVGKVERVGMDKQSGACGAALGAYKAIKAEKERAENIIPKAAAAFPYSDDGAGDVQEDYIIRELRKRLKTDDLGGPSDNALISLVTNRMYDMVSELLEREVQAATNNPKFWDNISEVTLLGGIVINKGNAKGDLEVEDYFMPVNFQALSPGGVRENLYNNLYMKPAITVPAVTVSPPVPAPLPPPVLSPLPAPVPAVPTALPPTSATLAGTAVAAGAAGAVLYSAFSTKDTEEAMASTSGPPAPAPVPKVEPAQVTPAPVPVEAAPTPVSEPSTTKPTPPPVAATPKLPAPPVEAELVTGADMDSVQLALNNALFLTALRSDRGQDASTQLSRKAESIIGQLAAMSPIPDPTNSASIQGTWELIYSDTQLFRSSPFFMAKRAACADRDINDFERFCKAQQAAVSLCNIGKIKQIISADRMVSEFDVRTGTIEQTFVSIADITPTSDGKAWTVELDETYIDGSNVPVLREVLDLKIGSRDLQRVLGATGTATFETTYLDETIRISRDQDGNVFVFEYVSEDTEPTDFSGVATDFGVGKLLEDL